MTPDIIQGNEKIARWMGWPTFKQETTFLDVKFKEVARHWKFHDDWSLLMPVVEKIEEMGYFTNAVLMRSYKPAKHFFSITDRSHVCLADAYSDKKIDAWYAAVLKFIDWYNQKK
jgi:hypothetical protein